ncbi:MAG: AAA family ATPase, partial [Kofleriaceae bacterium]|nr:AAA family ATPase [Kofleriaceae bacterium]
PLPYRDARARALHQFEAAYLRALIDGADGNASEAARRARMDRPYLLTLLRKHGLR